MPMMMRGVTRDVLGVRTGVWGVVILGRGVLVVLMLILILMRSVGDAGGRRIFGGAVGWAFVLEGGVG